ncbi:MAG: triple tyrosine motif-containing protein [Candidatus Pseudobacter hemicellulosilyticus]|uniref:histidine kinase n=1 Tax=Candidatus Pseudobacter hemicellulosilyticus TaxID=3121375 RepID=A0AAJ6BI89_9BACT|nr:MAG: triple tyrosine motif-containing protein [Pseudobacter sp.]
MCRLLVWLLALSPLWFVCDSHAQDIDNVVVRKYSQAEGLSTYNIRKIIKDRQGFFWIASQDGLHRFDGINFLTYSKSAPKTSRKLIGIDVRDLLEDTVNNCLWVLSSENGLSRIDLRTGNVNQLIPSPYINNDDWNICMRKSGERLWIGSFRGIKIYNINSRRFEPAPAADTSAGERHEVRSIFCDVRGNVWVCFNGQGISIFNGRTKELIRAIPAAQLLPPHASKDSRLRIFDNLALDDSTLLLATRQGLKQVNFSPQYQFRIRTAPFARDAIINTAPIRCLSRDSHGNIFIGMTDAFARANSDLSAFTLLEEFPRVAETNWFESVNTAYVDNQDNLWLGCQFGLGLTRQQPSPFQPFFLDKASHIRLDRVYSVCPLNSQECYAASSNGLFYINKRTKHIQALDDKRPYYHVFKNARNIIQAANNEEMLQVTGLQLQPIAQLYPFYNELPFKCITNNYIPLNDSVSCLGTDNSEGILLINYRQQKATVVNRSTGPLRLGADVVNMVYQDRRGRLLVLSDKLLTVLNTAKPGYQVVQWEDSISHQPYSILFDCCEANGYYWIGAYGSGILQVDSAFRLVNTYSTRDGLCNDGVYKVFNVKDSILVITTNNGLSVFDLTRKSFTNYYENDGLHSNVFEESSGTASNGLLYAGGVNGFTVIDPMRFTPVTSVPQLYFRNFSIQTTAGLLDTSFMAGASLELPANWLQTTIFFAGIDYYADPGRVQYRYRIRELHKTPIALGNQHFVSLVGLSPGVYHLEVQAANGAGAWSEPIELQLIFSPRWYQTWWFRIALILASLGLFYGLYRYRLAQLKKEERIRAHIASDLHDDIGSTLNSIKVYANLAMMKPDSAIYLMRVKEGVHSAIASVKDMVWVLDDKKDTVDHLISRLLQFAEPLCDAHNIVLKKEIDEACYSHKLGKEERRNLYMIIKESINNSIKYAGCTSIELTIKPNGRHLSISVSDDGSGFNMESFVPGNGIRNIRMRAREAGYEEKITAAPGQGTVVALARS